MSNTVLMLSTTASMIEQFNIPNIKLLLNMGYDVHVACNFDEGNTISDSKIRELETILMELNVKYYNIGLKRNPIHLASNIKAFRELSDLVKINEYKFIHCHTPVGGVVGRLVAKNRDTKVIYTAHGFHFFKGAPKINWMLYYPVEKIMSRYTDVLITINEEDYDTVINKNFRAKQIEYIKGIGINLEKFESQTNEIKVDLRKQYSYSNDEFILIYVGELSYRKNQDFLIKAFKNLTKEIPNIKLLLVGQGEMHDQYAEQIKDDNLEENIKLLGYRSDVPNLMKLADIAVSASRQEGLPVNVMEAMATGLPLVVSNCRGNRDLVKNGVNGFVYTLDNEDEFINSINEIYSNYELREEFKKQSLKLIEEYSLDNILIDMERIYKNVVE